MKHESDDTANPTAPVGVLGVMGALVFLIAAQVEGLNQRTKEANLLFFLSAAIFVATCSLLVQHFQPRRLKIKTLVPRAGNIE